MENLVNNNLESPIQDWEGWGDQSVDNLFESIEKSKIINLNRFIYALGIRYIGEVTAELIAGYFKNTDNLLQFISSHCLREILDKYFCPTNLCSEQCVFNLPGKPYDGSLLHFLHFIRLFIYENLLPCLAQ